jgi:hypothetical protein
LLKVLLCIASLPGLEFEFRLDDSLGASRRNGYLPQPAA